MQPPRDLTVPEPGSTTARDVLSQAIRRLLDDLRALPEGLAGSSAARAEYRAFRGVIGRLLRSDPGAVATLLRHPTVAVFLRALRERVPGDGTDPLMRELVATALLELAFLGVLPEPLRVTRLPARVVCLPGRFVLRVPAGAEAVTFAPGHVTFHGGGDEVVDLRDAGALEPAFEPVRDDAVLALVDNNPLAMFEAHPDKRGNAIDLGGRPVSEWVGSLRASLDLIGEHLPDLGREIALYLSQLVPVGFDAESHLSASYRESIGTVYLTLHPQPMTMAEAIIHEVSHNKLNALFELDPVLENAFEPLYRSPVRPDPRPLHGVLLAVHAFLPVARLYERMTEVGHPWAARPDFRRRYEEIAAKNRQGAEVLLAHGRPSPLGEGLFDEIARLIARKLG